MPNGSSDSSTSSSTANNSTNSLPGDITESIAIANVKCVAEQPSLLSNLSFSDTITNVNLSQQNAVAQQQAMNEITTTVTGKSVNLVSNLRPLEAVATVKLNTGNDLAQQIADLKASLQPLLP